MNVCLDGKVALVTGAGAGIGLATAQAFAEAGAAVALADIDEDAVRSATEKLLSAGREALTIRAHIARQALDRSAIIGPVIRDRFRVATCDHNSAVRFDEVVAGQDFRDALILHLSALASIDRVYKIDVDELLFARACQRRSPCPKTDQIIRDLVQRA